MLKMQSLIFIQDTDCRDTDGEINYWLGNVFRGKSKPTYSLIGRNKSHILALLLLSFVQAILSFRLKNKDN